MVEIEENARFWDNPADWPSGKVPEEGDDVEIEPGMNMYLNIPETPVLNSL